MFPLFLLGFVAKASKIHRWFAEQPIPCVLQYPLFLVVLENAMLYELMLRQHPILKPNNTHQLLDARILFDSIGDLFKYLASSPSSIIKFVFKKYAAFFIVSLDSSAAGIIAEKRALAAQSKLVHPESPIIN